MYLRNMFAMLNEYGDDHISEQEFIDYGFVTLEYGTVALRMYPTIIDDFYVPPSREDRALLLDYLWNSEIVVELTFSLSVLESCFTLSYRFRPEEDEVFVTQVVQFLRKTWLVRFFAMHQGLDEETAVVALSTINADRAFTKTLVLLFDVGSGVVRKLRIDDGRHTINDLITTVLEGGMYDDHSASV